MTGRNVAVSVRAKLLNKARADKRDFTLVLTRYALERLLYRLSISEHADHFLLKGALPSPGRRRLRRCGDTRSGGGGISGDAG